MKHADQMGPIGVFDSGYGGLTILRELEKALPDHSFIYLGDNARNPYGTRSYEVVYEYTLQAVKRMFNMGCHLIILACNTASAKALRTIQQNDLPNIDPDKRVLGVVRPSVEKVGDLSHSRKVGVLGTTGTIESESYPIEIAKLFPDIQVFNESCPMWVPLVENNEFNSDGADYFIHKNVNSLMNKDLKIDTVILGCTHYPLLLSKIKKFLSPNVKVISQGPIVADRLVDYLSRHPEMDKNISRGQDTKFYTTESVSKFQESAGIFLEKPVQARHIKID